MEIGFHHGALCKDYETQANEQGFTFGDKKDFVQKNRVWSNFKSYSWYIDRF